MLIICAGRSRSGSTLLYNLIRLTLMELVGSDKVYSRGIRSYNKRDELAYNVVKLHDSNDPYFFSNATYVFSSVRDSDAQRKSILKFRRIMKDQELTDRQLNKFIAYDKNRYKKWSSHKNFVATFDFADLVSNKQKIIESIADTFNMPINNAIIVSIINKLNSLKLPSKIKVVDPETCLTWHHFTSI